MNRHPATTRADTTGLTVASALVVLAYLLTYTRSIDTSLAVLTGDYSSGAGGSVTEMIKRTAVAVPMVIAACAMLGTKGRLWLPVDPASIRAGWRRPTVTVGVVALCLGLGALIARLLVAWGLMPESPIADRSTWDSVLAAVNAGVGEEIIVLAGPALVLMKARVRPPLALAVLVAIRLPYHLYFGWAIVWLLPWAIAAALLFWFWPMPSVLGGLIGVHILFDMRSIIAPGPPGDAAFAAAGAILLVIACGCCWQSRHREEPQRAAAEAVTDG